MAITLHGQTALVTGASRGIGRGITLALAQAGADVALFARGRGELADVAAEVEEVGGRALVLTGSVTDPADVKAAVAATVEAFGAIDFLVNNAGRSQPYGPIGVVDAAKWWDTQGVNVFGPMLFMSEVIPSMRERGSGRVMNMTSMAGLMIAPGSSAYTVSKSTLIRLSEHVHAENVDRGLAVFVTHPGSILTDMVRASFSDPDAPKRPIDPNMADNAETDTARVGEQAVALASGAYDALAGRFLDLEKPLDESLARLDA